MVSVLLKTRGTATGSEAEAGVLMGVGVTGSKCLGVTHYTRTLQLHGS